MPNATDVTLPDDREIRVTRVFDAPRGLLFECHTDPELVRRWMGCGAGWSMAVCEIDLRVGGSYRHVWRNDADGSEFGFVGEYREIVAPERIVHTERPDGPWAPAGGEALCTLTLAEADGRTTVVYAMRFPTREVRDTVLQTGMAEGMAGSYDRLEALVAAGAATT